MAGYWTTHTPLPTPRCGGSWRHKQYSRFLYELVKELKAKNILEIGFNNGHSALSSLNASPNAKMVSFDICNFGYEMKACSAIQGSGFDIELIKGNSKETVPLYLEENPDVLYDYIFVDGDHRDHTENMPYVDINNTAFRLSQDGLLLIDDWNLEPVRAGAHRFIKENGEEFIMYSPLNKKWRNEHPDHPASKAVKIAGKIGKPFRIIARR